MHWTRYGITLRLLSYSDIEQVRHWRNQDFVRLNMEFQGLISLEEQEKWFSGLDGRHNHYFIFSYKNVDAGMVNLKNLDLSASTAEAGIFVGDKEYLNTYVPFIATIVLMEFAFDELKLTSLLAKIKIQNKNAIGFNERLGYHFKERLNEEYAYYECVRENFKHTTHSFIRSLQKF